MSLKFNHIVRSFEHYSLTITFWVAAHISDNRVRALVLYTGDNNM